MVKGFSPAENYLGPCYILERIAYRQPFSGAEGKRWKKKISPMAICIRFSIILCPLKIPQTPLLKLNHKKNDGFLSA